MATSEAQVLIRQKEHGRGLHRDGPLHHSVSDSALGRVKAAKPGGPWIYRGHISGYRAPTNDKPPENEASAFAWKAARKMTLHGIVGTGNRISSVVQYPVAIRDPKNLCQSRKNHLSAEDRRILRVMVKYHLRRQRGTQSFNDAVLLMEKHLLRGFAADETLCMAFYQNEDFANKLLEEATQALERGPAVPEKSYLKGEFEMDAVNRHGAFCGPQCYCLKHQDLPLSIKPEQVAGFKKELWEDDFRTKTRTAAASVVAAVGAVRVAADARLAAST